MPQIEKLPCEEIIRGDNDRTVFKPGPLQELAASIDAHGLAQPITVRKVWSCPECGALVSTQAKPPSCATCGNDSITGWVMRYQIVAGERRYRAVSQILGKPTIDAIVKTLNDEETAAIMLAENTSREDLDPIDEGRAYQANMDRFGWDRQTCASKAGVSVQRVAKRVKLLQLREEIRRLVRNGDLKLGYANVMAEAGLDRNRQVIALRKLRENPKPTRYWFRKVCNKLKEEQAQAAMFDLELLTVQEANETEAKDIDFPPHPETDDAPWHGGNLREVIEHQIDFWTNAANRWDALGKPHKRQECMAAARGLKGLVTA